MAITVYGLSSCDACRKTRRWLSDHGLENHFHDFRRDGVDSTRLAGWLETLGWENVLNRQSTTWRSLAVDKRSDLDANRVIGLILKHPALIKRPLVDVDGHLNIGFDPQRLAALTEGLRG